MNETCKAVFLSYASQDASVTPPSCAARVQPAGVRPVAARGPIATTIAQTLRRRLSGKEKAQLARTTITDPEAHCLNLEARDFQRGSQQEIDKSIDPLRVARTPQDQAG
jgi:hypothetical protein